MDPVSLLMFWLVAIILAATIVASVTPPNTLVHKAAAQAQVGGEAAVATGGAAKDVALRVAAPFVPGAAAVQQTLATVGAPPPQPAPLPAHAPDAERDDASRPLNAWVLALALALLLAAAGALYYYGKPKTAAPAEA